MEDIEETLVEEMRNTVGSPALWKMFEPILDSGIISISYRLINTSKTVSIHNMRERIAIDCPVGKN